MRATKERLSAPCFRWRKRGTSRKKPESKWIPEGKDCRIGDRFGLETANLVVFIGELEKAVKKRDMKFVTAFHHAANWLFFPVWDKRYDTGELNLYRGMLTANPPWITKNQIKRYALTPGDGCAGKTAGSAV